MQSSRKMPFVAVLVSTAVGGCFSPNESLTMDSEADEGGTTATSVTGAAAAGESSNDGSESAASTDQASDSSGGASATDEDGADTTGGGPPAGCGDGIVGEGEECDDGADGNGSDQACLESCELNVCGDGHLGPAEACDDGDGNELEVGACAPDCSTVVEEKVIGVSATFTGGDLQPNPVGFADGLCPAGQRALFATAGVRQATNGTPFAADAPIDWPLQPYTAYVNTAGALIWMTDSVPLLGVRDGAAVSLQNPIADEDLYYWTGFVTGLSADWTTLASDNCNGWTSDSDDHEVHVGIGYSLDDYLDSPLGAAGCSLSNRLGFPVFYCVEQ